MKINKLFHWLYAILLLLPFIMFLSALVFNNFKSGSIDNIVEFINQQFSSIWTLPIFSWASSSFLIEPFNYIANLFGIASDNLLVVSLDYWLCISIIWLVFDLIMYIPLLVHKWIDKAVIS